MVRKAVVLVTIGLMVGCAAWGSTTTVGARAAMSIPPLTRLSWAGAPDAGREILVSVEFPHLGAQGSESVELKSAVVLTVRSNVPWALVVRPIDPSSREVVEVRTGRGEYRPVQLEGLVLARGLPGVHEIVLDYRVNLGEAGWSGGRSLTLVYAVEG
ncbi:hypothetical protein H5T55_02970 [Candidatus Bipolaricaulota bacterium]|nr:hypothetical protein [Candidatus Bipolaricaulota bacterium]